MKILRKPASLLGSIVAFVFAFAFIGVISSCAITIGIWPGQVKLLAPLFCTDAQPDAFVVADTYSPEPGETVTNFSLYCMGPRGDATDHGFMKPFLLISVVNGIIFTVLIGGLLMMGRSAVRTATTPYAPGQFSPDQFGTEQFADEWEPAPEPEPEPPESDRDHDRPKRSPAPPGSTPGPFVD